MSTSEMTLRQLLITMDFHLRGLDELQNELISRARVQEHYEQRCEELIPVLREIVDCLNTLQVETTVDEQLIARKDELVALFISVLSFSNLYGS
ncbi:hypothetical protein EPA93_06015 [Ktedonosporobacter rubrisoli]|uniref:Uncharacterized protein n=1 Tax=Ktedonosporobacter rubrisoli TaxID=2509675 RepID=A0A4P6JKT3_KTERU|nr:hypothetical protein [Ktedonosporobacter rubrisoli]QBD75582.1 hypothetical protein EPA93_06015 [Ktedonosporobacter rubrisoli]